MFSRYFALLLGCFVISYSLFYCTSLSSDKDNAEQNTLKESRQYDLSLKDKLGFFEKLPLTAVNNENLVTAEKIKLGQTLYFDKRLSANNTISCNSCHNLTKHGVDGLAFSPGDAGKLGDRNSPTVLNAAFHTTQFWDGRAKDVEEQAGMPVLNPVEMAIPNEKFLIDRLSKIDLYKSLFASAFPGEANPISFPNLRKAIAVFERQLITPSRFDKYLGGDSLALSVQEKKGLMSFVTVGCASCHNGALLGGNSFQKFGVHQNYWEETKSTNQDEGRYTLTHQEADKYMFKTPSLRNVAETSPYFHDGSVKELSRAVDIMAKVQLKYTLSENEKANIVAFLQSLNGEIQEQYKKAPMQ